MDHPIHLQNEAEKAQWVKEHTRKCSITGETYVGYGNNAYPFPGLCSDDANLRYVIPARILGITPEMIEDIGIEAIKAEIEKRYIIRVA